jgi:hypothetical protein
MHTRSAAQLAFQPPTEQELPTRRARSELREKELWETARFVRFLLRISSNVLTAWGGGSRAVSGDAAPAMDLNTTYQTSFKSTRAGVCASFRCNRSIYFV